MTKLNLLLLTIFFFTLPSLIAQNNPNFQDNIGQIVLNLKGYERNEHKNSIYISIENSISPINQQLNISDAGKAEYSFSFSSEREVMFNYDNRKFSLILSPNSKTEIDININELLDWARVKNFNVTGPNQETNSLILEYTGFIDSLLTRSTNPMKVGAKYTLPEFKDKRLKEMTLQLEELSNRILLKKITNKKFINWCQSRIKDQAGCDLAIYPFLGVSNKSIDDKNEYFNFIRDVKSNNAINFLSHLRYLETISYSFEIIGNISDTYADLRLSSEKDVNSNFHIIFNIIKALEDADDRRLVMAYFCHRFYNNNKIGLIETYQDSISSFLGDKLSYLVKSEHEKEMRTLLELLESYSLTRVEKTDLMNLYSGTKDKVIFHDFWFAACGPCIKELQYYNALMDSIGSGIIFVFYGVYMEKDEWTKVVKKLNLRGRNYLLSKNQLAFFEKYFGIHGFPHHQIIDSSGHICNENIISIHPDNFSYLKSVIVSHKND